jgi:hypothetical protein
LAKDLIYNNKSFLTAEGKGFTALKEHEYLSMNNRNIKNVSMTDKLLIK